MNDRKSQNECLTCVTYLYDYLSDNKDSIPKSMIKHIDQCSKCQEEIKVLETELSRPETSNDRADQATRLANLELHFAFIDKLVGCNHVKPFLASMSSGFMAMSISTPITAHIDKCPACSKDYKIISDLQMTDAQLFRAGQLLAMSASNTLEYEEISDALAGVDCNQSQINKLAEVIRHPETGVTTQFSLNECLSYQTGQAFANISEEPETDINILDNTQAGDEKTVDVTIDAGESNVMKRGFRELRLLQFVRPLAAAAAVLLVAVLLFNGPQATGFGDVFKALEKARNIYMKNIQAIDGNVAQETWTSMDLNIKLFKSKDEVVLWDINNELLVSRKDTGGEVETLGLDEDSLGIITESMNVSWSILPFDTLYLPPDAVWQTVSSKELGNIPSDIEVHDLLWTDRTQIGNMVYKKWRGYLNSMTMLPIRIEFSRKLELNEDYQLETIIEVEYPDTEEIKEIIDGLKLL